jgi:general secretion pathway protein M
MPTLSPRERIVVGAGAAVALLVGGYLLVVEPLMARARTAGATVPVREEILERRREQIRQQPRLTEELTAVNARLAAEGGRLLSGPTAPLAASELQQMVKEVLAEAGVEIRSERVLPAAEQQGLQEVAIEMAIMGTIRHTVGALARLERTSRLLALKDVKIRVVAVGQPRELLTTLVVAGYVMPGGPAVRATSARSD